MSACDGFMAEKGGDGVDVHSVFQEAHSEGVAEAVEGYVLLNLGEFEESGNVETQFITRQIGKHQASFFCVYRATRLPRVIVVVLLLLVSC